MMMERNKKKKTDSVRHVWLLVIALVGLTAMLTEKSYGLSNGTRIKEPHKETADTTERIILQTTHLENIFLDGQEVWLKGKFSACMARELFLSLQISRKSGKNLLPLKLNESEIKLSIGLNKEVSKKFNIGVFPVGTYLLSYSFSDQHSKIVSKGEFELVVIKDNTPTRETQLQNLRKKNILVPTWGWSYQEMCDAAKAYGYNVFNAPFNAPLADKIDPAETSYYFKQGIEIIARPTIKVTDPFDPSDIQAGCQQLAEVIDFYGSNPGVLGFSIAFGLYGEGGIDVPPYGNFEFSGIARKGFNDWMNTPGEPLPIVDTSGLPGSMRYIKWMEYRQKTLRNFRKEYISEMKKVTNKLVGTWSEVYPLANYTLNMGDAPGADFMFYDCSFGDVSFNQKIAFAETHGDMQHYPSFELWKQHIMPLVAKAYGEGVIPMGFQFPMRRGHATDFLATTKNFTDRIEDEYALKIGPEFKKIMSNEVVFHDSEIAFVYQSYGASAFPQDSDGFSLYNENSNEIEALLHMMGVDMDIVPLEKLGITDLDKYKLVVIPDAMYLTEDMYKNLKNSDTKVLVTGDFLRAYWDGKENIAATDWGQNRKFEDFEIEYGKSLKGEIKININHELTKDLEGFNGIDYDEDRYALYKTLPADAKVFVSCNETPVLIRFYTDKVYHITNRIFGMARRDKNPTLEQFAFQVLKNVLKDAEIVININEAPQCRAKDYVFAPYGLSNNILWNQTDKDLELTMHDMKKAKVPKHGWAIVGSRNK